MLKVAILDMYAGKANEGMRCIRELVEMAGGQSDEFHCRLESSYPDLNDYDAVISSGGPGDPHEVLEQGWGSGFRLLLNGCMEEKKPLFLICHSFQMACLLLDYAEVTRRHRPAFGIYHARKLAPAKGDEVFGTLSNPFWMVDSRDYQVVQFRHPEKVLAIEKERPHVPWEPATLAVRFSDSVWGTQFHPEGDDKSLENYLTNVEFRTALVASHGEKRVLKIEQHLNDPRKLAHTRSQLIPKFLQLVKEQM